jgi:hypothetical protein
VLTAQLCRPGLYGCGFECMELGSKRQQKSDVEGKQTPPGAALYTGGAVEACFATDVFAL